MLSASIRNSLKNLKTYMAQRLKVVETLLRYLENIFFFYNRHECSLNLLVDSKQMQNLLNRDINQF